MYLNKTLLVKNLELIELYNNIRERHKKYQLNKLILRRDKDLAYF